ncbi:MAG: PPOX class F420-dependent enzyme [Tepidiforma sp.]|jgi:PPOX class probable F420-dependent enzyme|uniref:PPOX class F420-dependent oxidoreductase n=1 Tax=Tepidiforma bonchosmolovskayae TaxID=2601677 RepID=A0ABX6BZP1_9CHLR|nr:MULTISPECIES: PPOX class F420-dependent oxidoreductase [Tepidiforma]QFG02474.1 PPOX class F420-dependent oxidoreductase [Tepidiforma bonchosmolovskayae]GIW16102.1 MAG: PPOX class F420-dependent enzyme [Tepidiforma sp.]
MPASIPASHRDLFEKPNFGHLATLMPDGSPQVTPVWVDIDGDTILINTAEGRVKTRNLDRDGRVAISVADQQNPYRYIQVRGRVVARTHEGADAHIDRLAKKYLGQDRYPFRQPGEQRVIFRIQPEHVQVSG